MRYIRAKFHLPNGPAADGWDTYGFETIWHKKTQQVGTEIVANGDVVPWAPIRVEYDGKFLFPATPRNVAKAKAMAAKGQLKFAPGEKVEADVKLAQPAPAEEVWPSAPGEAVEDAEFADVAKEEAAIDHKPVKAKRGNRMVGADATPDVEG